MGKLVNRETISYIFFGVLTTIISIGSYAIFLSLFEKQGWLGGESGALADFMLKHPWLEQVPNLSKSLRIFAVNTISWAIAVVFAFITNKLYVFQSKSRAWKTVWREATSFVGARVFSLAAETAVIVFWVSVLGGNELFAKAIVGQILVLVLNYLLSKLFVFKKAKKRD